MRALLAIVALAGIAVISAPFVFAEDGATQDDAATNPCRGTFGEYRVHCLESLKEWEA
jgi:hypothetical protein